MLSFCPSPVGNGSQACFFQMFFIEKLLNVTPSVPVNPIPPPHPAESSNWSEDFSSTFQLISTVPSSGLGTTPGLMVSWLKYWRFPNSRVERIRSERLNS